MKDLGYDPDDTHDTRRRSRSRSATASAHAIIAKTARTTARTRPNDYADAELRVAQPAARLRQPGRAAQGARALAADQPLGRGDAERHHPARGRADVHRRAVGRRRAVRDEARRRTRCPGTIPGRRRRLGAAMNEWLVEVIRKTAAVDADRPRDDRHLARRVRPQLARRERREGLGEEPGHRPSRTPPQVVRRGDFARVMAEFWADGPKSETPPGHWNTLANAVSDAPGFERQPLRQGRAARSARVGRARLPRAQRRRARRGDRGVGHQAPRRDGAPDLAHSLDGGQGAVVRPERSVVRSRRSPARARAHRGRSRRRAARRASATRALAFFVGQIAVRNWLGEPGDRVNQVVGRRLGPRRRVDHLPAPHVRDARVPRRSSPGTARSAAPAPRCSPSLTGSPYFPGGFAEFVAPKDDVSHVREGPDAPTCGCSGRRTSTRRTRRASRACGAASTSRPTTSRGDASATTSGSTRSRSRAKYFSGTKSATLRE